jgi:hypothetical protein
MGSYLELHEGVIVLVKVSFSGRWIGCPSRISLIVLLMHTAQREEFSPSLDHRLAD